MCLQRRLAVLSFLQGNAESFQDGGRRISPPWTGFTRGKSAGQGLSGGFGQERHTRRPERVTFSKSVIPGVHILTPPFVLFKREKKRGAREREKEREE